MSKRYFYTNPLAAAWMAKHFGMNFHTGGGDFCQISLEVCPSRYTEEHFGLNKNKWWIHPESLHLLEPQDCDFLQIVGGHYHGSVSEGIIPEHMKSNWTGDPALQPKQYQGFKIIQRNSIAFMWPESEEA